MAEKRKQTPAQAAAARRNLQKGNPKAYSGLGGGAPPNPPADPPPAEPPPAEPADPAKVTHRAKRPAAKKAPARKRAPAASPPPADPPPAAPKKSGGFFGGLFDGLRG